MSEPLQATDVEEGSVRSDERMDDGSDDKRDSPVKFKGFKKRKMAQKEKMNTEQGKSSSDIDVIPDLRKKNLRPRVIKVDKSKKGVATSGKIKIATLSPSPEVEGDSYENQTLSQTEYFKCLGLQPTMQFTCPCCGEKEFPSRLALNMHQRGCGITQKSNSIANLPSDMSILPSDPNLLKNVETIKSLYLCSACGTHYEIWDLFLHTRDVHKKHICLYCLAMFGLAEQLADHLRTIHNIQESNYKSSEEFQNAYKGSCYLICCTCENMFNERDDYFYHECVRKDPKVKCNLCGAICGHYDTCPNRNITSNVPVSVNISEPSISNKAESDIEDELEKSKSTAESEFVIPEECPDERKNEDNIIIKEGKLVKNVLEEGVEDNKTQSDGNILVEQNSSKEVNISLYTETFKDFHLDNVSPIEKPVENSHKENESTDMVAQELCESALEEVNDGILLASEDVPAMALTLEDKLENVTSQSVIKECVRTSCLNCEYCSHAIKIAVNGKQLALHLLAKHRYKPIKNNETSLDVIKKLKNSLTDLEVLFFNTDSYDSSDKSLNTSYDYTYECFQCRFVTKIHKELYTHKWEMHQKTILLCVMCKSTFCSYSELLCHMCPGLYVSEDVKFRCCFCNMDMIPSAFRLLVHLRKTHHTCDICLQVSGDQQKLSTHIWKHGLNHLCYRCGIAYNNTPDITKHLFWKHGTESVLCKKCLQSKWPHVYHFCILPTVFICKVCNANFTKAVALKVHERLHSGELPHKCRKCDQKFVSKKLLVKHEDTHTQPRPVNSIATKSEIETKHNESKDEHINVASIDKTGIENTGKSRSLKYKDAKPDSTPDSKHKIQHEILHEKKAELSWVLMDHTYCIIPGKSKQTGNDTENKEKLNHKRHKEEPAPVPEETPPPPPFPEEEPAVDLSVEPVELPIRESDLDTNESSADEDFYDKYPQSHAKQQMEKRNELILLASVAPVNNGTVSPIPPPPLKTPNPPPAVKRKIKTKKRIKNYTNKTMSLHQQTQPSTSFSIPSVTATSSLMSRKHHNLTTKIALPLAIKVPSLHSDATAGSSLENESAGLSKRKQVRNKFCGYSNEEEEHDKPGLWRVKKTDILPVSQPSIPSGLSSQTSLTVQKPQVTLELVKMPKPSESSKSSEEPPKKEHSGNSSSSSYSENDIETTANIQKEQTESDKLYCYCQCPYDRVSDMIACDGQDCIIEWFHFECVGIMVPPKGKWYCHDCRKRRNFEKKKEKK